MNYLGIDIRKTTSDDWSLKPKYFQEDDNAELIRHTNWAVFMTEDDAIPHVYFRNMDINNYRWAGFVRLGDGPIATQTSVHHEDIAQDVPINPYREISKNPITYGTDSLAPFTEFRYNENGAAWKEGENGSILDVKVDYFPFAIFMHAHSPYKIPYFQQQCILTGTYNGKPIKALGAIDRIFAPKGQSEKILSQATIYVSPTCAGIRKDDGRLEYWWALINEHNGKGMGIYWIEGEEPIIATDVWLEADWYHLPYAPDDPTVAPKDEIWRFGGKEFHFISKWSCKGFTAEPRMERVGQTESFGTWYVGPEPYEHTLYHSFNENMAVTKDSIKRMGFKVVD